MVDHRIEFKIEAALGPGLASPFAAESCTQCSSITDGELTMYHPVDL